MSSCERCGISEEDYGFEFVQDKQGEPVCEEHLDEDYEEVEIELKEKNTPTVEGNYVELFSILGTVPNKEGDMDIRIKDFAGLNSQEKIDIFEKLIESMKQDAKEVKEE